MSIQRLHKYVALALNNSSEGEARNAASRFFKTLKSLDMRFNSKQWNLTKAQALQLAELGGVKFKGVEPTKTANAESKPKAKRDAKPTGPALFNFPESQEEANEMYAKYFKSARDCCYYFFNDTCMDVGSQRRIIIDNLVSMFGFDKRSVQSYASNYRAGKWR